MRKPEVAVLFADDDSVYKDIPECDVYDNDRDALTFNGDLPVVAHPPCRLWGRLRRQSTAPESEKDLALFAVAQVRKNGGVIEHPAYSTLWGAKKLPLPGDSADSFGGITISIKQYWFGHPCEKKTWIYVVGIGLSDIPPTPFAMGAADYVIESKSVPREKVAERKWRTRTPDLLARWLCDLAISAGREVMRNR